MLGWALKKGFQGATGLRDAPEGGGGDDTTQIDAPDTPAPIFAARAFKNAIWGHSTAIEDAPPTKTNRSEPERVELAPGSNATTKAIPVDTRSPTKLNSILLTPGTGTSRRKRVSFGRDVKTGSIVESSPLTANSARSGQTRKKTTLQQAMEDARPTKSKAPEAQTKKPKEDDTDEEWEWEDEDVFCNHDLTVDLNEPHSESGKYWKAEWSRYREEAKSDIELLVKYKANARSFAAKKDMEASQLSQKLKEEQSKVAEMEKKLADMATKLAATRNRGAEKDNASITKDLARQIALVAEYRDRVRDLEARLKEASSDADPRRAGRQRIDTSPRTEQSILDASRELKKARSDLKELGQLRDEVQRLKTNLAKSRERVAELEAQASAGRSSESSRIRKLEKQLRDAREVSAQKDVDIKKFKEEYESLKNHAKSRIGESMQVLQDKNAKIDELERKLKEMEAANILSQEKRLEAAIAQHDRSMRDLKLGIQSPSKLSRHEKSRPINRRARAASIDDTSLDMTRRSLLRDGDNRVLDTIRRDKTYDNDLLTDYTADIPTFELQAKDTKTRPNEAKIPYEKSIMEDTDAISSRQADRDAGRRSLHGGGQRVASDILSNRVNESSRRQLRRNQPSETNDALAPSHGQEADRRTVGARTTSLAEDRTTTHGALDPLAHRSRAPSRVTRPVSLDNETPAIDLVQDQFSRLGGPSADRTTSGNVSRCALPADRQAAARARLEQKRMEKGRARNQMRDKENVRP
ncbi:putative urease accessory protein [Rosellinia necatrix]|uniref:Putative urease accessory protein n=1 Tax=Rosellinia necatrix TaxID=77044 RepID=A0A1S8A5N2_ROSNE|nr:putative urease accessory protein [Rosellinia necatrix]